MPSGDEEEKGMESDSTDPLVDDSEGYSGTHARSTLPKSSRGCRFSSGSLYEDDDEDDDSLREVLDAVPELRSSKLVGDECKFIKS